MEGGSDSGTTATYRFPVELGKVREFARATKATATTVYEDAAPVVPPTFLTVAAFWTPPGEDVLLGLGLDWSRLLHGGTRYVFRGEPPRAGDDLWVRRRLSRTYVKERRRSGPMRFIEYVVDFNGSDGHLVAQEFHTTIETTAAPRPDTNRATSSQRSSPDRGSGPKAVEPFVDEPLTRTDIIRYQGASGDLNPIHHDDEHARDAGFDSAFSVGMQHAGILGSYVASVYGPENVREFGVRFVRQTWPGDVVTYAGRASSVQPRTAARLRLDLSAGNHTGYHLVGHAAVIPPS